jgi:hypothetical protein
MALRLHVDVDTPSSRPPRLSLEAMQLQRMDVELRQTLRVINVSDHSTTPRYFL